MSNRDLWAGLLIAALGLLVLLVLIPHGVTDPQRVRHAALAPSYYPTLIGYAMTIVGIGVMIQASFVGIRTVSEGGDDLRPDRHVRVSAFFAILATYAATAPWLGFIVASALAALVSFWLADERRLHVTVPLAIVVPSALFLFFEKVANVPIPRGVLTPLLKGY